MFLYFFPLAVLGLCLALVPRGMNVPFLVESSPGHIHGQMGAGRILPPFLYFSLPPVGRASAGKPLGLSLLSGKPKLLRQALWRLWLAQGLHCYKQ